MFFFYFLFVAVVYILFKTIYPNINISVFIYFLLVVGGKTHSLLGFFQSKICGEKKCWQSPFSAILRRKKVLLSTKPRGRWGCPLNFFLRLPLMYIYIHIKMTIKILTLEKKISAMFYTPPPLYLTFIHIKYGNMP